MGWERIKNPGSGTGTGPVPAGTRSLCIGRGTRGPGIRKNPSRARPRRRALCTLGGTGSFSREVNHGAEEPVWELSHRLGVVARSSERLQPRLVDLHL